MSALPGARERFELTREHIKRLNEIKLLLMYGCDDWKPPNVGKTAETSDPTANQAIRNVDVLEEKVKALRAEEAELEDYIGVSLAIIAGVKAGFGEIYGYLLEWRYIDGWSWERIKKDKGIKRHAGYDLLDIAFDWIDSVGVSRLLKGDIEI